VELQRAERFNDAAKFFEEAVALNPDNAAALINQEMNELWRKEHKRLPKFSKNAEEKLKLYHGVDSLIAACGPIDLPEFAMEIAQAFAQTGLYRQSAQMIQRALAYAPGDVLYQTALANVELMAQKPDRALALVSALRPKAAGDPALQVELSRIQAFAQYGKSNFTAAEKILKDEVNRSPGQDAGHNALANLYASYAIQLRDKGDIAAASAQFTNALRVLEDQIRAQPQNPSAHFNYGNLLMFMGDYARSADVFTKVLELQKDNGAALLNRASSYLQSKKLDEAKRDYEDMLSRFTTTNFRVYYGLGEIAYQQKDWSAAKENFEKYLRYVPANSGEAQSIRKRLEELKKKG